jgi:putative redox protein
VPARPWQAIEGPAGALMVHVASGAGASSASTSSAVVLVHDFPIEAGSAERTGRTLPVLADRLADESGWRVLAGCLRGAGGSAGDFSPCGWMDDVRAFVGYATELAVGGGVWVVGFGVGGTVALCEAAGDDRVRGVGCLGSPASLDDWAQDPKAMLASARRIGLVTAAGYPPDVAAWARQFTELRPLSAARALESREVLVVHGSDDDDVPVGDAKQLADAAGRAGELRVLAGAAHRLRGDPRALAILIGWLERQRP